MCSGATPSDRGASDQAAISLALVPMDRSLSARSVHRGNAVGTGEDGGSGDGDQSGNGGKTAPREDSAPDARSAQIENYPPLTGPASICAARPNGNRCGGGAPAVCRASRVSKHGLRSRRKHIIGYITVL